MKNRSFKKNNNFVIINIRFLSAGKLILLFKKVDLRINKDFIIYNTLELL